MTEDPGLSDSTTDDGRRPKTTSKSGTETAAVLYTLLETAKLHEVDPAQYLLEAARAADRGDVLLPWQVRAPAP